VAPVSGKLFFRVMGEGVLFAAQFLQTPRVSPPTRVVGDGHCEIHRPPDDGDSVDNSFFLDSSTDDLDLGTTLTATNGTTTFSATVDTSGGGFRYRGGVPGPPFGFASTWTLTNSGSPSGLAAGTIATMKAPAQVVQDTAPQSTTSGHVTITWSGGEGADYMHINILGEAATVDCYPASTSTSFDLPPEVFSVLDRSIVARISAESVSIVTLGDRRVQVRVSSDNLD
jgi:hypothetical protein